MRRRLFGWNENSSFVIRGGYGLSHAPLTGMGRNPSPDFAAGTTGFGTFDTRVQFPGTNVAGRLCCNKPILTPIAPDAFLDIPEDGLVYLNSLNIAGLAVSSNAHIPYVQSFSLSMAYEAPHQTVIEVIYNGSKGTHLFLPPININPVPFELTDAYLALGLNPLTDVTDPLGRTTPTGAARVFSQGYIGAKFLGFENLSMMFDSSANSIRHAATVSLSRRHNRGLSYTVNYTFGKGLDDASDAGDIRFVNLNVRSPGHVNYGASRSLDRSVSLFDIKHAFSASWVWDLPVGRGRQFLSKAPGLIDSVIGGWSLSGIGRIQGGIPMVAVLRDDNRLGVEGNPRNIRPDLVQGVPLINPNWDRSCPTGQNCEPYFNPSAFMRPAKGTLGSAPRAFDNARSPTQHTFDMALKKDFALDPDAKRRLEFRVDFINAFNHPFFRMGRLEDSGEIFALPNEGDDHQRRVRRMAQLRSGQPARPRDAGRRGQTGADQRARHRQPRARHTDAAAQLLQRAIARRLLLTERQFVRHQHAGWVEALSHAASPIRRTAGASWRSQGRGRLTRRGSSRLR